MSLIARWDNHQFAVEFIKRLANGNFLMRALHHGPRFTAGTEIEVALSEIISGTIPDEDDPTATDKPEQDAPSAPVIVPLSFYSPRPEDVVAPVQGSEPMSDRLFEKLKAAAGAASELTTAIEARADDLLARKAALMQRQEAVFARHEKVMADSEAGLDAVENALRQLSNGGA